MLLGLFQKKTSFLGWFFVSTMRAELERGLNLNRINESKSRQGHIYISKLTHNEPPNIPSVAQQIIRLLDNNTATTWTTYTNQRDSNLPSKKPWPNKLL